MVQDCISPQPTTLPPKISSSTCPWSLSPVSSCSWFAPYLNSSSLFVFHKLSLWSCLIFVLFGSCLGFLFSHWSFVFGFFNKYILHLHLLCLTLHNRNSSSYMFKSFVLGKVTWKVHANILYNLNWKHNFERKSSFFKRNINTMLWTPVFPW